jgi:N-acetylglucosaminyldiphosphoundecaprenol N-acetyl-beta-D-mannosaminyltransferase
MVRLVQAVGRCVLFVAFGAPRQDEFIRAHLLEMDAAVAMGVGGTLDILAGNIRRAPAWMQGRGLEWVWRLAQEPGRLWRRYLLQDIPFLARFAMRVVRGHAPAVHTG